MREEKESEEMKGRRGRERGRREENDGREEEKRGKVEDRKDQVGGGELAKGEKRIIWKVEMLTNDFPLMRLRWCWSGDLKNSLILII